MICTGSYKQFEKRNNRTISISGDRGKNANYAGPCYKDLAPNKGMWQVWHNNINNSNDMDNNRYYIREYIKRTLSNLNVRNVYRDLAEYTLLCYEESNMFCHRHIVACWLEDELGIVVPEVGFADNKLVYLERPSYIKKIYDEEKRLLKR